MVGVYGGLDTILNDMEQIHSWEATSRSAGQEVHCLSRNTRLHYHVDKILTSGIQFHEN
jgi:hypothetical protein